MRDTTLVDLVYFLIEDLMHSLIHTDSNRNVCVQCACCSVCVQCACCSVCAAVCVYCVCVCAANRCEFY